MTNDLETIHTWLQSSYSVVVPPDWLAACVEWIQQEHGGQPLSAVQLQPMVFEQWLMADLKELGAVCLPEDLPSQLSTFVHGPLALQVESMLDVGVPLYGQLQKVKGTANANSEVSADRPQQPAWEPKPSRMMLLKMTDGQTCVQGMEYQPIPAINPDLQPGFKVIIHGQVKCRRGVLMLTADNVQVLGGEVDSLMETKTSVAVLEEAMELGRTNNGKHARKEFSGRFLKKQDFKEGSQDPQEKKFKTEVTSSLLRPASGGGGYGTSVRTGGGGGGSGVGVKMEPVSQPRALNSGAVKQEPPSQPHTVNQDDEWEDDLDYGGLLDEPMEEDLPSQRSPPVTARAQQDVGPHRRNPFASPPDSETRKSHTSWQCVVSVNSGWNTSTKLASGFGRSEICSSSGSSGKGAVKRGDRQTNSGAMGDDMWGDDDDFDMVQMETEVLSPVIPVQTPAVQNVQTADSASTVARQASQGSSSDSTTTLNTLPNLSSSVVKAGVNSSSLKSSSVPQNSFKKSLISKVTKSCSDTKPPPAKQRKLTAMFMRTDSDNTPVTVSTHPDTLSDNTPVTVSTHPDTLSDNTPVTVGTQPDTLPDCVVDLTDDGLVSTMSPTAGDSGGTLTDPGSVKQETKGDSAESMVAMLSPGQNVMKHSERGECHDTNVTDQNENDDNHHAACGNQNNHNHHTACGNQSESIPKAVIPPLNSEGEPVASCPEPQTLKSVQNFLQSGSGGDATYTVKGYITTLTDRLRSCQGDRWSLSCRITDGTATMEVALADKVLAQLIGFTAKESITLRQQARKDAAVKDFLTEGLQKCQKSLIEFSGLMDLQGGQGDKPSLVNMVQLEVKER